jgi:hypothetical protein
MNIDETETADGRAECRPVFRVLLAYSDLPTAIGALQTYRRIAHTVETHYNVRCSLWHFDHLADDRLLDLAAEEAAEADMIILATAAGHDLPKAVGTWLESLSAPSRASRRALVALLHGPPGGTRPEGPAFTYLETVARERRMAFFATTITRPEEYESLTDAPPSLHRRGSPSEHDEFPGAAPARRWGIND